MLRGRGRQPITGIELDDHMLIADGAGGSMCGDEAGHSYPSSQEGTWRLPDSFGRRGLLRSGPKDTIRYVRKGRGQDLD